ncbi:hypothetical protein [Nocardia thraciensis]
MVRDPLGFPSSLRDDADVVTIHRGPKRLYTLCPPELVGELLIRHGHAVEVGGRL